MILYWAAPKQATEASKVDAMALHSPCTAGKPGRTAAAQYLVISRHHGCLLRAAQTARPLMLPLRCPSDRPADAPDGSLDVCIKRADNAARQSFTFHRGGVYEDSH